MKRYNHLHEKICDPANVMIADDKARKNKKNNWGIIKHDRHLILEDLLLALRLKDLNYKTSEYKTFKIYEPKERVIFRLPYYPDRITHHAIMNVMEPIWVKTFITNTYSCVKERGIHKLAKDILRDLKLYPDKTKYCLKLDITKFYPSINHDILKQIVRRKIKDKKLLVLLDEIIDSADGVPIGNYLSLFFANLYLTYFDHWLKEEVGLKFYYRYADDIVVLHDNKEFLHNLLIAMKFYLDLNLKLKIKPNYLVFPVDSRGVDFVGYKFFHTHTLLRKSIKLRLNKLKNKYLKGEIQLDEFDRRMSSYFGWLKYCNSKNLLHKIEKLTGLGYSNWNGEEMRISKFYKKKVWIVEIISHKKYYEIHLIYNKKPYTVYSTNRILYLNILNKNKFPIQFKLLPYVRRKKNRVKSKTKDS